MKMKRGFFITFEGAEGSGKSTQIKRAASHLRAKGYTVLVLREPGTTRIGEAIREVILNKDFTEMAPSAELLLYLAARAQIMKEKITPALKKKWVVICDRFEDSTLAYQGFGRKMPIAAIETVSKLFVRGSVKPNLTFLLDIDPRQGMARGGRFDRMEKESLKFHQKVRKGFLALAARDPKRFVVVDAALPIHEVAGKISEVIDRAL